VFERKTAIVWDRACGKAHTTTTGLLIAPPPSPTGLEALHSGHLRGTAARPPPMHHDQDVPRLSNGPTSKAAQGHGWGIGGRHPAISRCRAAAGTTSAPYQAGLARLPVQSAPWSRSKFCWGDSARGPPHSRKSRTTGPTLPHAMESAMAHPEKPRGLAQAVHTTQRPHRRGVQCVHEADPRPRTCLPDETSLPTEPRGSRRGPAATGSGTLWAPCAPRPWVSHRCARQRPNLNAGGADGWSRSGPPSLVERTHFINLAWKVNASPKQNASSLHPLPCTPLPEDDFWPSLNRGSLSLSESGAAQPRTPSIWGWNQAQPQLACRTSDGGMNSAETRTAGLLEHTVWVSCG